MAVFHEAPGLREPEEKYGRRYFHGDVVPEKKRSGWVQRVWLFWEL